MSLEERGLLKTMTLKTPLSGVEIGDSVSINGCCLTVRLIDGTSLTMDLLPETLDRTTFKQLKVGSKVNLERPLTLQKGIHGHLVQGHVDGVGKILKMDPLKGEGWLLEISTEPTFTHLLIEKGSVAVEGVSLTVIEVKSDSFSFSLIPHTAKETTLGEKKVGDFVNLEGDMIAKYIKKWIQ